MVHRKQLEVLNAQIKEQHQENENIQELLKKAVSNTEFFTIIIKYICKCTVDIEIPHTPACMFKMFF